MAVIQQFIFALFYFTWWIQQSGGFMEENPKTLTLMLCCWSPFVEHHWSHTHTRTHALHPAASAGRSRDPGVRESSSCWDFLFPCFPSEAPSVSRRLSLFFSHLHRLLSAPARQLSLPIASVLCLLVLSPPKQQQKASELSFLRLLISLSTLFIHQVTLQNCQTTLNFWAERWIWSLHIDACLLD